MAYTKGESGNPAGKPRGAKNKTTEQVRRLLQTFLEGKIDELETIWEGLENWQKFQFLDRLLRHTLPPPIQDITQFSESDIDLLLAKLKSKQYETAKN